MSYSWTSVGIVVMLLVCQHACSHNYGVPGETRVQRNIDELFIIYFKLNIKS